MTEWEHEILALESAHKTLEYFNEDPEGGRKAESHI